MSDVVTFGELMLRLTPPGRQRFGQAAHFEITFGGAEANVAVMVAQLGGRAEFVSRLPENDIAQRAINELRGLGVATERIARGGERMGVYYLEQGASQRAGKVIYDRAHSAIVEAKVGEFDWEAIFAGALWFHFSGITPALSPSAAELTAQACAAARRLGLTISFDLNYRAKLWSREQAGAALAPLMEHVDLCVTSVEEARTVFGLDCTGEPEDTAAKLRELFDFKAVALTQRSGELACSTGWGGMLLADGQAHFSRRHEIEIVDRVGAGDCFTGALIFSLLRGDAAAQAIEFAVAASTLKHTIPGDYAMISLAEVEALAGGASGSRVQR
jgi:2-dehydro-3-deoxygluconokinase